MKMSIQFILGALVGVVFSLGIIFTSGLISSKSKVTPVLAATLTPNPQFHSKYGFMLTSEDQCLAQHSASFNSQTSKDGNTITFTCKYDVFAGGNNPVVLR